MSYTGDSSEKASNQDFYPLFLKIKDFRCLIVGGGKVGERKAKSLLRCGATVYLISEEITPWFKEYISKGRVKFLGKEYSQSFLDNIQIVFATTSSKDLNSRIVKDALERGLLCNSATNPEEGNFILPASLRRGHLVIAVSTSGASPAMASLIRDDLASTYDEIWEVALKHLEKIRKTIQDKNFLEDEKKQEFFRDVAKFLFETIKSGVKEEELGKKLADYLERSLKG